MLCNPKSYPLGSDPKALCAWCIAMFSHFLENRYITNHICKIDWYRNMVYVMLAKITNIYVCGGMFLRVVTKYILRLSRVSRIITPCLFSTPKLFPPHTLVSSFSMPHLFCEQRILCSDCNVVPSHHTCVSEAFLSSADLWNMCRKSNLDIAHNIWYLGVHARLRLYS